MLVVVSPELIEAKLRESRLLLEAYRLLERDEEVQELLRMSNINAVTRLRYNDHGPVHARIVSGSALEILDILVTHGLQPTSLRDKTASTLEEARLVVLLASYLHDIGNAVHREDHETIGALMARDIVDRILEALGYRQRRAIALRQEVLHAIYATEYSRRCLTMEAGVVKIADGTDMSMGRARIPYKMGKTDMHAMSALSIKSVEIERGSERPVKITVHMSDYAGLFQIEQVLMPKILTSSIEEYFEIWISVGDKKQIYYPSTLR